MRITAVALAIALALPTGLAAQERAGKDQPPAQQAQLSADAHHLIGKKAADMQGKKLGEIKDVLVGQDGRVQALVMDLKGKNRAVPWDQLSMQADQITIKTPEDQLSQLPEYRGEKD